MTPPAKDNLKSVRELIAERPEIDNTDVFRQLREIEDELWAKIAARFELHPDASAEVLQPYSSPDGSANGWQSAFTGPDIDWAVCTWIGNPARSFCNLHITVWLGPHIRTPHLAFAFGTFPVIFFLMDYVPRVDVRLHPEYLDRYLNPVNQRYLAMQEDKRLMPFISQSTFVRNAVTGIGLNFIAQPGTEGIVELVRETAHERLDQWLKYVDEAEPVPEAERAALREMDLTLRRNFAELDPANEVAEKIYGKELTQRLVRGLWGGERVNPRP